VKKSITILVVLIIAAQVSADTSWTNLGTGSWKTAGNWSTGVPSSSGTGDVLVQNGGTAMIDSAVGTVGGYSRLKVGTSTGGGHLLVAAGGSATFDSETRIGDKTTGATVAISGGSLTVRNAMRIGYTGTAGGTGSGSVTISGGSFTLTEGGPASGELVMGYGTGTNTASLEIDGSTATISTMRLIMTAGATKMLTYGLDAGGVSRIQVTGSDDLAFNGTTLSIVCNAAIGLAEGSSITLIDNQGSGACTDTFSGKAEGSTVTANYGSYTYQWTLTYKGGTGNDVVLTNLEITGPIAVSLRDADDTTDYTTWAIGEGKALDTAYIMQAGNCVLVKNAGSVAMDVSLSATGTNWTLGSSNGVDRCVLMGLFNGDSAPAAGDFSTSYDVLSSAIAWATSNGGNGLFEGTGNGTSIAGGSGSKLYVYLKTPASVSAAAKATETITVTIGCREAQ
jgi:hypothetical protein